MKRLTMIVAAMLTLVTGACGDDDGGATGGAANAQTFAVQIDGESDKFNGEFAAFFPAKVEAHAGDTVKFDLPRFSGVPHTVTFGTLVNDALAKFRQLPPTASIAATENFPEMMKLTDVFPHEAPKGPPVPNQSAAQPCFLKTGEPPNSVSGGAAACPQTAQPAFDGTYSFYNSGALLADGDSFTIKFADNVQPGTYSYLCLIHRGGMSGDLTVVDAATKVPTANEVKAAGKTELDKLVTAGEGPAKAAAAATADKAVAGTGSPTSPSLIVAEFGPKSLSIPVGGTVTWNVFAFHTISLNAKDSDIGVLTKAPDGSFQFPPSGAPSGFNVPPGAGDFPPADNEKPMLVDGGKWDGTGSRSTGILGSLPPRFIAVKLTFTKAGTYGLRCLVHPEMKGEVKVG